MTISANIRQLRKKAGFTQIELAEKLGVSIATL
ncbi:MAG: helix-turn-helix transcriptional regulator, partial [Synergistaceae bacterium]|nr:helix-turn-helix transcriptional regulator [Synergistaceae bacterium]